MAFFRSSGGDSFDAECLRTMNDKRSRHQAPALRLNTQISRVSQQWADQLARMGSLTHNNSASYNGQDLGENIAMRWSSDGRQFTGGDIIDMWYEEVKNYSFRSHSGPKTGHFTQLVWKDSKEVGIGKARSSDGKFFVVANFFPAGNFLGRFAENVLPPKDGKIVLGDSSPAQKTHTVTKTPVESSRPQVESSLYSRATPAAFPQPVPSFTVSVSNHPNHNQTWSTSSSSFSSTSSSSSSRPQNQVSVGRQVFQETSGRGSNAVTKNVVIETVRNPDGSIKTVRKETVSTTDPSGAIGGMEETERKFQMFKIDDQRDSSRQLSWVTPQPAADKMSFYSGPPTTSNPWRRGSKETEAPGTHSPFPTSSSSSGGQSKREFIDEVVRCHNNYRRKHGRVGDLSLNSELCDVAQKWAEHLAVAGGLRHSSNRFKGQPLGENVAYKYGTGKIEYTGEEVVSGWYSEIKHYDFKNPDRNNGSAVGHFTQVVWKGSQEIGVGKALSRDGAVFVVCNYFPAGNVMSRFKENVFAPK